MFTIWKVPLEITDEQQIMLPMDAVPLTVQMQGEQVCLWVQVNTEQPEAPLTVHIYGTGNPMAGGPYVVQKYIGTVQTHDGALVWHVYWQ